MNRTTRIRSVSAVLVLLFVIPLVFAPIETRATSAAPTFTITGTGWGHGIGMSQYGAYGAALAGKDYRWILGHYYSGTTLDAIPMPRVKVNIDAAYRRGAAYAGRPSWTMMSVGSKLNVRKAGSTAVIYTLEADTFYRFTSNGAGVVVSNKVGTQLKTFDHDISVFSEGTRMLQVQDPSNSVDGSFKPLQSNGLPAPGAAFTNMRYRGIIRLTRVGSRLSAVNDVPMYQYLYGVIPREMPAGWHSEALKAQAVAARSYSYENAAAGRVLACTTWDQVYKGHSRVRDGIRVMHEDSRANTAENQTRDQVLRYGSRVITTFFFSQSGGHTANNEDVWVTGAPRPELRGVPDPYEHLAKPKLSPWPSAIDRTGLDLASALRGLSGVPASASTYVTKVDLERASSGHVKYANFLFSDGTSARVTGDTTRSRLGLRSTRFYLRSGSVSKVDVSFSTGAGGREGDAPRMATYSHSAGRAYEAFGYFKPRRASNTDATVRVLAYRYERKADGQMGYVYKLSYLAKVTNPSGSAWSKYSASVKLPSAGKWRVRVRYYDDGLTRTTTSGYRTVTVAR